MTFAQVMKATRKKLKVSQAELAVLVGSSRPSIANYEAGICQPAIGLALKISRALNFSLDTILVEVVDVDVMRQIKLKNKISEQERKLKYAEDRLRYLRTEAVSLPAGFGHQ